MPQSRSYLSRNGMPFHQAGEARRLARDMGRWGFVHGFNCGHSTQGSLEVMGWSLAGRVDVVDTVGPLQRES